MFGPEAASKGQVILSLGPTSASSHSLNYRRVLKGTRPFLHVLVPNKDISPDNLLLPTPDWGF